MTRHDHRGRFTAGSRPEAAGERGVPLLACAAKNPSAVALGRLGGLARAGQAAGDRARVIAAMNKLRRDLGLPEWRPAHG